MSCRTLFIFCAFCLPLMLAADASAELAPGDYDGDSRSDLGEARVNRRARTTEWNVRLATSAQTSYSFAAAADGFVLGHFVPDKRVTPGIVTAHDNRPLEWRIKTPEGGEVFLHYGFDGDILPNLGDLDCDGITDIAVVRNNGRPDLPGFKIWYTALSGSATIAETAFGSVFDRVATADVDGDDCHEMIVLREGFHWYSRKLGSTEVKVVQWGLPGDIPLLPFDVNDDGSPDYSVVRTTPGGQLAYVRLGAQSIEVVALGSETSVPLAGRFDEDTSFAFVTRSAGLAQFAGDASGFSFGTAASTLIRPDGGIIDSDETGRFFRAGSHGVMSSQRAYEDLTGVGCGAPRIPDGKNKKRAWSAIGANGMPRYQFLGKARRLEIFSASGKLVDNFDLLKPGSRTKRELWEGNLSAAALSIYAPLLLKETNTVGTCNWIDINNPNMSWD